MYFIAMTSNAVALKVGARTWLIFH